MTSTADEDEGRMFAAALLGPDNDTADPDEAGDDPAAGPANHVPREGTNTRGVSTDEAELRQFTNDLFTN